MQYNFMNVKWLHVYNSTVISSASECPEWLKQVCPFEFFNLVKIRLWNL